MPTVGGPGFETYADSGSVALSQVKELLAYPNMAIAENER